MRYSLVAASLSAIGLSAPVWAQTNVDRFERQLEQIQREQRLLANPELSAGQRALFDYGGYLGLSYFAIDDIEQETHQLRQYDLVGYGRLNIDNAHEFYLRARTSYQDFNDGDSFDGDGDETIWPTVEEAYYRFNLAQHMAAYKGQSVSNNIVLQAGRQWVFWANSLVLGQIIDGGLAEFSYGKLNLQVMAGVTAHDTVDFDASRPEFDKYTKRVFTGALLSTQLGRHRPYIYFLDQDDQNDDPLLETPQTVTAFEYNSYYVGAGSNGSIGDRLLYGLEVVYEGGSGLSNSFDEATISPVRQTEETIEAGALDFRLDYLVPDERRTRLSHETILATGDRDRVNTNNTFGGNRPGTADHAFNAWGFLNTGLAFAPPVSNLAAFRFGASTFPFATGSLRRLQVGADLFFYAKFLADAPIDEPTTHDRFLGFEPDLYLNWRITSDITFALRYGVFFPGSAIISDEHPRNFLFAGLTFSF